MTSTNELKRLAEGREAEIFEWEPGTVLRLFRDERDAASIAYECAAMEAVRAVVPLVPKVLGVTEVMGRPGIIMERIDGPDLLTHHLEEAVDRVEQRSHRRRGARAAARRSSRHRSVPSLLDRARLDASPLVPPHIAAWALRELATLPDGDRLLHGDFHPANILMASAGPVVIDWPNITRGNPDADLGRSLLMIRMGELPPGSPLVIRIGARVRAQTAARRRTCARIAACATFDCGDGGAVGTAARGRPAGGRHRGGARRAAGDPRRGDGRDAVTIRSHGTTISDRPRD